MPYVGPARLTPDRKFLEVRQADGSTFITHGSDFDHVLDTAPLEFLPPPLPGQPEVPGVTGPPDETNYLTPESNVNTYYPGPERKVVCTDLTAGSSTEWPNPGRVELIYLQPRGSTNRYGTYVGEMKRVLRQMAWWINERGKAYSSAGLLSVDLRTYCNPGHTDIIIANLASQWAPSEVTFARVRQEIIDKGYTNPNAKYLILYDDPVGAQTGQADLRLDCNSGSPNRNNQSGAFASSMYAVVWGITDFRDNTTALHEMFHTMGAVQDNCALNNTDRGHCTDEIDVMCYDDDGVPETFPIWNRCVNGTIDCYHDDYFDPLPETGENLANHWNVGGLPNRFLRVLSTLPGEPE